jgi:hypothetical protein
MEASNETANVEAIKTFRIFVIVSALDHCYRGLLTASMSLLSPMKYRTANADLDSCTRDPVPGIWCYKERKDRSY